MNPEDRMILTGMLSHVEITNDIYFACEEGYLKSSELYELQGLGLNNYGSGLKALFEDWYQTRATPEQQLLVDLNGLIALNDQFDDLQSVMAVKIKEEFLSNKEKLNPEHSLRLYISDNIEDNCSPFPALKSGDKPIKKLEDLKNNANIVYLLNCSQVCMWRDSVNHLLFRLSNNHYNGVSASDAMNYLLHERNQKMINYREQVSTVYQNEIDYLDDSEDYTQRETLVEKVIGVKKNKAVNYAKKALKRGLKTLADYIGDDNVALFSTESGFIVEGELFNYRIRKSHTSLIGHTMNPIGCHIPYDLIVMNKENVELSNLCIYFDETPIIDQVIATVLFLQSGQEKQLIKTGNFFNRREEFHTDPLMRSVSKVQREVDTADYESLVERVQEMTGNIQVESLGGFSEGEVREIQVSTNIVDGESDEFQMIRESVFKALPNFIGAELPVYVYDDFKNMTFDAIMMDYQTLNELPEELENYLEAC